jgi:hypothetical protein
VASRENKMVLIWNDIKSFQRHLEDMKEFRQSHLDAAATEGLKLLKDMPIPFDSIPSCGTGIIKSFTDARGKIILVPIWKTTPPKGSQN